MQTVDLEGGSVRFVGALDLDRSAGGIGPRRLPAWTRPQITDPFLDAMVAMSSGVRIAFSTDSEVIELDVALTTFRFLNAPSRPQVFQLVIDDGEPIDRPGVNPSSFVLDMADPHATKFLTTTPPDKTMLTAKTSATANGLCVVIIVRMRTPE